MTKRCEDDTSKFLEILGHDTTMVQHSVNLA
jgi:hypothetical protein